MINCDKIMLLFVKLRVEVKNKIPDRNFAEGIVNFCDVFYLTMKNNIENKCCI